MVVMLVLPGVLAVVDWTVVVVDWREAMVDLWVERVVIGEIRGGQNSGLVEVHGLDIMGIVTRVRQLGMVASMLTIVMSSLEGELFVITLVAVLGVVAIIFVLLVVGVGQVVVLMLVVSIVIVVGDVAMAMCGLVRGEEWGLNVLINDLVRKDLLDMMVGVKGNLVVTIVMDLLVMMRLSNSVVSGLLNDAMLNRVGVVLNRTRVVLNWAAVMVTSYLNPVIVSLGKNLVRDFDLASLMMSELSLPELIHRVVSLVDWLVSSLIRLLVMKRFAEDWLEVLMLVGMDMKVSLLIVVLIAIAFLLVIVGESLVLFASDGISSLDPAGNLVRRMSRLVDVVLNVVITFVSDLMLDSHILDLRG